MVDYYKETLSKEIIKNLEKRNMEGFYVKTKEEARSLALSFVKDEEISSWGGSMTLEETGILDELKKNFTCLDRDTTTSIEEKHRLYAEAMLVDNYFMSTNAITTDGELINIDGYGNRIAALIFGPKKVIVVCSINKVCHTTDEGIKRARNIAGPMNAIRLKRKTPCVKTGTCHDCLSPECICSQMVITRRSSIKDRIKVILVGENIGY